MKLTKISNNVTQIATDKATVLFSYNTPVAACIDGKLYRTEEYFSMTTSKHIGQWGARNAERKPQSFFESIINCAE